MKRDKQKKRRNSGFVSGLILVVSLSVFLYSGYRLASILLTYRAAAKEYSGLQNDFTTVYESSEAAATPSPTPAADEEKEEAADQTAQGEAEEKEEEYRPNPEEITEPWALADGEVIYPAFEAAKPPLSVNWSSLKAVNSEIVGWLYVDALPDINYPILKTGDNDYYLHHTFRHEYLFAGSIFMDYNNSEDFSDPNTIIYGHNMRDGSMFGKLYMLGDEALWEKNPYFWILTPEADYRYRIYSVMETPVGSETYTLFSDNGRKEFLDWEKRMQAGSVVKNDEALYEFDLTVTLSTCTSDESTRRVVLGRRVYALSH